MESTVTNRDRIAKALDIIDNLKEKSDEITEVEQALRKT